MTQDEIRDEVILITKVIDDLGMRLNELKQECSHSRTKDRSWGHIVHTVCTDCNELVRYTVEGKTIDRIRKKEEEDNS